MKLKSITASWQGSPSISARPITIASPSPVFSSASARRSVYGRRSKKPSGSAERSSPSSSAKDPVSASCSIRSRAESGKWWPHWGHTPWLRSSSSSR